MLQSKSDNKPEEYERICLTGTPLEPTYLGADPPTVPTSIDALGGALALVLKSAGRPLFDGPNLHGCQQVVRSSAG